tara:strand:- start:43 stop:285 length:243 start_codon:yes stop_codon:yes gene_type:complete
MKLNKTQFNRAVQEGYYDTKAINPVIRFSSNKGFHVESGLHAADDDVTWQIECNISANTGKPHLLPTFEVITEEIQGVQV